MKLDATLALKSQNLSVPFSCSTQMGRLELSGEVVDFEEPVHISGSYLFADDTYFITGTLKSHYRACCGRCLESFVVPLELSFAEEFVRRADDEKPDQYVFEGDIIDLTEMVDDLVVLNIPIRHICREDCRGLCPVCGTNRNITACGCATDEEGDAQAGARRPFEALAALLHDENEEV
ncbi:MAG: DUF177 domain-containing protein [Eubacteriales bacterium]|nr:DUF177 domain-containing protein [Eubacteriales bacterium]